MYFLLLVNFLSVGCARPAPAVPEHQPTSALLKSIDVRSKIHLARLEVHTTVDPNGLMHCVRIENKRDSPARNDAESTVTTQRQLSPQQINDLARLFDNWDLLQAQYGGVADGGNYIFRYGGKTIVAGSAMPRQLEQILDRLDELGRETP